MEEPSHSIVESRQELTISMKNNGNPTFRTAHFLKPSFDSTVQAISTLSPISLPSLPPTFDPPNWPLTVKFRGWKTHSTNWNEWVHKMASSHSPTWKKAGIYDAIFNSTHRLNRHNELILGVAERWCPDTNSFCFPWGEASVTLEDMFIAGYSVLGSPVFEPLETEESREIEEVLIREKRGLNKTPSKKPYHNAWLNAFMDSGSELEHEAFLSLWLSRFVLPTSKDVICDCVFPIAIHLARGTRIALAPAVLACIYRDLTLLKQKIVSLTTLDANDDKVDVTTYAPFQLVLVWVWERFVKLSPKPNLLKKGEPRFALWNNVKCNIKDVRSLLDSSKDCFNWRPYTKVMENWDMPKFYGKQEMQISLDSDVDEEILSFIMCLRVSELVGLESECIEPYLPQGVARQFGFDQDLPGFVSQGNATRENAWDCYIRPVTGIECYIPSRVCEGEVTTRYLEWLNHSVKEKGLETSSSSPISSKSLKRKTSAGELNVSKVSATYSKRTKEGESSQIRIEKKAEGERSGLKISAQSSERIKKVEASNSEIRKKAAGKLKGSKVSGKSMKKCETSRKNSAGELNDTKVSAKSSERMKKGNTSNSPARKKRLLSQVSANSPKRMDEEEEEENISSFKITPVTTKHKVASQQKIIRRKISSEVSVAAHANQAKKSKISAESSRIKNSKLSNKPAISLVVEINDSLVPPKNDTGDFTADDNITIAEMIKHKKNQCARGKKPANKLESHLSPVAAEKTSDFENEKDGASKTAFTLCKSYSYESLKGFHEEILKQSERKQSRSDGNVSDQSHYLCVASKETVKHNTAGGSEDEIGNELGGLSEHVENVDHGDSISSANNKALESLELGKGQQQDMDIFDNAPTLFDQPGSHSSSVAGNNNKTPTISEIPENDCRGGGNVALSNEYSIDSPNLMMLEARIEKLWKMMAARKAVMFQKRLANKVP